MTLITGGGGGGFYSSGRSSKMFGGTMGDGGEGGKGFLQGGVGGRAKFPSGSGSLLQQSNAFTSLQ